MVVVPTIGLIVPSEIVTFFPATPIPVICGLVVETDAPSTGVVIEIVPLVLAAVSAPRTAVGVLFP
jgi:hypothetical protein